MIVGCNEVTHNMGQDMHSDGQSLLRLSKATTTTVRRVAARGISRAVYHKINQSNISVQDLQLEKDKRTDNNNNSTVSGKPVRNTLNWRHPTTMYTVQGKQPKTARM